MVLVGEVEADGVCELGVVLLADALVVRLVALLPEHALLLLCVRREVAVQAS